MLQKFVDRYCRFFSGLMVAALAVMVLLVFGNVVMRYGFNSGFTLSEELSRWLFVWMTFLGAVVALNERTHLGTDTLVSRLPVAGKKFCLGVSYLLMLMLCGMVFWGSWEQTRVNLTSTSAVMEASLGIFYATGVVFSIFAAIILLAKFWQLARGQMPDSELVGFSESEDVPHADLNSSGKAA
jgi:TRAP-type C4-dicarboxylate transport system permease small subunit